MSISPSLPSRINIHGNPADGPEGDFATISLTADARVRFNFYNPRVILLLTLIGILIITGCNQYNYEDKKSSTPSITASKVVTETQSQTPENTITLAIVIQASHTPVLSPTTTLNPFMYVFPVRPDKNIGFTEGTSAHGYPAIDIFAPDGWDYVAVTSGTVEFVSYKDVWDPSVDDPGTRGGIAISIIGDDGIRYYGSHLSKISEGIETGMHVSAGQLLGSIGDSGNARGRGSHLHFGISRPTYPEDWKIRRGEIDPFPYINAWVAGINVSPKYSTPTPKPTP
jgi:peptidoglycan LD-endopeptidase LytH